MSLKDPSLRVFFYKHGSKIHEDSDLHFHLKSKQVNEQMFGCFANWDVVSHLEAAVLRTVTGTALQVCLKHSCAAQLPLDE